MTRISPTLSSSDNVSVVDTNNKQPNRQQQRVMLHKPVKSEVLKKGGGGGGQRATGGRHLQPPSGNNTKLKHEVSKLNSVHVTINCNYPLVCIVVIDQWIDCRFLESFSIFHITDYLLSGYCFVRVYNEKSHQKVSLLWLIMHHNLQNIDNLFSLVFICFAVSYLCQAWFSEYILNYNDCP